MDYSHEQATHDEVNLLRLVRRLEKSIASEKDWDDVASTQQEKAWLQALGTLQKVKHGRKLLRNLEDHDSQPSPKKARQRSDLKTKLDRVDLFMTEVRKPDSSAALSELEAEAADRVEGAVSSPEHTHQEPLRLRNQIEGGSSEALSSSTLSPPPPSATVLSSVSSLLPATPTATSAFPISSSTAISTSSSASNATKRKHLQTTNALHEELSNQLAEMAAQLKRNAQHFANSLEEEKPLVEMTSEKLEENFGTMLKERIRLRDFRLKSKGSTWMVIGIVIAVLLLFVVMVGVIRFSRR
ncbi:hypothetical protein NP233_g5492 [Leucocoprinus birnbaumii]|uniref:Uncharacterized protein n=1 Tax=Leucocoprinus birnbaumii TaxID=56174 RepID=A0AAD5VSS3_9AGAR|nr:hypothetical protein NP233_g5492 [Leucocoprinus birnbaumii]